MQIPNLADAEDATQAQVDSRDFSDILAPAFSYTGVLSGCAVAAQGTPNMTVAVSAGVVVVNGTVVTVAGGNVTISANASGNARFDLICVDAAGVKSAVAGTPSASPVFPNPAGKVVLAAVRVPTGVASISNAKLVDKRVFNTLSSLAFGSTGDTNLYRQSAGTLRTDGPFVAGAGTILLNSNAAIYFGAVQDTNIYRSAANQLTTPGGFIAGAGKILLNTDGGIYFSVAQDTVLYRGADVAPGLVTNGSFLAGSWGQFSSGVNQVVLGDISLVVGGAARSGIVFGNALDTNLYRVQANILGTDGQIYLRGTSSYLAFYRTAESAARFYIGPDGNMNWGSGAATQDTNLSRAGAGLLLTDSIFASTKDILANRLAPNQIWLNADGAIYFGSASDTRLYRTGAASLQTDGAFYVGGSFDAVGGRLGQVAKSITDWNNALDNGWYMGAGSTNAPGGLGANWAIGQVIAHGATGWRIQRVRDFTAVADSQVYERRQLNGTWGAWVKSGFYSPGANVLKTDYEAQVGGQFYANMGLANQFVLANDGKMYFGSALDTNLYRGGAGQLRTNSRFLTDSDIAANVNLATMIWMSTDGRLYFGQAADTNLYRSAANALYTNSSFTAVGRITSTGDLGFVYSPATVTGYILGSLIQGEGNWRWLVDRDGGMNWGPGGAVATDTTFYRMQTRILASNGGLYLNGTDSGIGYVFNPATAAGNALATLAASDTAYRFVSDVNGRLSWGPGNVAGDTFLYRGGAGMLRTDGQFITGGNVWVNKAVADSQPQILLSRDLVGAGKPGIMFGPGGTTAPDVNLYRDAVGALATDSTLRFNGGSASKQIFQVFGSGDTVPRFLARVDGYMGWGPGGSTGIDVSLFRLTPTDLKTDGNFYVHKSFIVDHQGGAAPLYFGASFDTSIWRNAAARLTTNSHITISADAHTVEFSSIQAGAPSGGSAGGAVGGIVVWVDGVQRTIAFYNP